MAVREGLAGSISPIEHEELRRSIARALPGATAETARKMADTARVRRFARDQTIFCQGEPIPLTLVVRGYGALRRTTVDGRPLIIGVANPGHVYGLSSLSAAQSPVDLLALTDSDTATWAGPDIRALAATDPGLALAIIDGLSYFLTTLTGIVDGFLRQDARRRVVRILARHRDLFFDDPPILSRSQLPSLVGTSREMTGRVLRELEREGTVKRVGPTGLRLLRPEQLVADAEPMEPSAEGVAGQGRGRPQRTETRA